jgi:hypothetical protein
LALRQHDKGTTTTQCPDREATKSHRRTRKPSGTIFSDFQFFRLNSDSRIAFASQFAGYPSSLAVNPAG